MNLSINDNIEIKIDRLSSGGGRGVGRAADGMVVFVPFTAPGDLVKVVITELKKSFAVAELVELLEESDTRRQPLCPVFGKCGGCQWQHINYQTQVEQKANFIQRELSPFTDKILDFIPADEEYYYRNRIQLHSEGKKLGYHGRSTHQLVEIDECVIAEKEVNAAISDLKQKLPLPKPARWEISRNTENQVQIYTTGTHQPEHSLFAQVNEDQNQKMIATVLNWTKHLRPRHILDLYSGAGNFSFPLAQAFPRSNVTGVELSRSSVNLASRKLRQMPLKKLGFSASDVGKFLDQKKELNDTLVVLDPPRAGLDKRTRKNLMRLKPTDIIYVSCNLGTLKRDIIHLSESTGYKLIQAIGVDMFPQTDHVEVIAQLRLGRG